MTRRIDREKIERADLREQMCPAAQAESGVSVS